MDALVKLIVERTGLPESMAKEVVSVVLDYLKEQLPDPIAGQIDSLLGQGSGDETLDAGDVLGALGGLFGNK